MAIILEAYGGRRIALEDVFDETQSVGIKGVGLKYTQKKEKQKDFERNLLGKLSFNPWSQFDATEVFPRQEHLKEFIIIRGYSPARESTWYDSTNRGGGKVVNLACARNIDGFTQSWEISRVDTLDKEGYTSGEQIPIIHSLFTLLESFMPVRKVTSAKIWLETGKRIRNGFYLTGLEKDLEIGCFTGRELFIEDLSKGHDTDPPKENFYRGIFFAHKKLPFDLSVYYGESIHQIDYTVFCSMDQFPSWKNGDSVARDINSDTFLWADSRLKYIERRYNSILKKQKGIVKSAPS
jgi:hypothetical protein